MSLSGISVDPGGSSKDGMTLQNYTELIWGGLAFTVYPWIDQSLDVGCPTGRGQGVSLWGASLVGADSPVLSAAVLYSRGGSGCVPPITLTILFHLHPFRYLLPTLPLHHLPHARPQTSDHFIHKDYSSTYLWVMWFSKILINQIDWRMKFSGKWNFVVNADNIE